MRFRTDRLGIRLTMTGAAAASWLSGIAVPGVIGSSKMLAVVILATAWLADFSGSPSLPPGRKNSLQERAQEVRLEPEPTNTGAVLFIVVLLLLLLGGGMAFLFLVFAAMGGCCR